MLGASHEREDAAIPEITTKAGTPSDPTSLTGPQAAVPPATTPKGATRDFEHAAGLAQATRFKADAQWLVLRKKEKPVAEMFYVYYRAADGTDARPVTFVFNGGPGAASAYLHVGGLGPRRVAFSEQGDSLPPPVRLVENAETWLGFTDLVFVDPIGTGFSRLVEDETRAKDAPKEAKDEKARTGAKGEEEGEFFAVKRDLEALGEFIAKFLSKHGRWTSPVYIAGESYGGFRVAKLARMLQEGFGVGLSGAILISPAIEMNALDPSDYDAATWIDTFPSFVAAAVYHGRSQKFAKGAAFASFRAEAERFAMRPLSELLTAGDYMAAEERAAVLRDAAAMLGLPQDVVERSGGRLRRDFFARALLRDARRYCGIYDAAITAVDPFPDRDRYEGPDPTLGSIDRSFTAGVNAHLRQFLGLDTDRDYHLLSMEVNMQWKNDLKGHLFDIQLGAADDLRYGMSLNPHMKVMIVHGIYDLITPYFSSARLARQLRLPSELSRNLVLENYPGGHMFYTWDASRVAFTRDVKRLYALAPGGG